MYCAAIFLHFVQIVSAYRTPETVSNIQNGEARTAYFENALFDNTSISLREFGISAFRREPTDKTLRMIH